MNRPERDQEERGLVLATALNDSIRIPVARLLRDLCIEQKSIMERLSEIRLERWREEEAAERAAKRAAKREAAA